jgi:hypothetical protein
MTNLPYLLSELEARWLRLGFRDQRAFDPGLAPTDVRRALSDIVPDPAEEVIEWFSWHNGLRDPEGGLVDAAPSGFSPMSMEAALAARESRLRLADELAQHENSAGGEIDSDYFWPKTWLPIGEMGGPASLVVDVGESQERATVFNVDWGGGDFRAPIAASLSQAVLVWIMTLEDGYYAWSDADGWVYDFAAIPRYLRGSLLVG